MINFIMAMPRSGGINWPEALTRQLYLANKVNLLSIEEWTIDKYITEFCDDTFINFAYDEEITAAYLACTQYEKIMVYNEFHKKTLLLSEYIDMSKPGKIIVVNLNDSFALRSDPDVLAFFRHNGAKYNSAVEVTISNKFKKKYYIDRTDDGERLVAIKQPKNLMFTLQKFVDKPLRLVPYNANQVINEKMIIS